MKKKNCLVTLSVLSVLGVSLHANTLYRIANPTCTGEVNQVEGIHAAFVQYDPKVDSEFLDAKDPTITQKIERDLKKDKKVIVIGAGEEGITAVQNLPTFPNLMICLTSHAVLERYRDPSLLRKIDFVALPSHAVSTDDKRLIGPKLIETIGVSHNRNAGAIEETYEKSKGELPACRTYLGVILGGDAPLSPPAKGIKWFTSEDVIKLADYVAQRTQATKECVVVLNGPRTGKYDAAQEEISTVHREGRSDPLTELFVQTLKEKGVQAQLFDFQHKTLGNERWVRPYNSFDLVVGALRAHKGILLVPGESTSMISEAIDMLPLGKVLVYKNGAMNEVHAAHVKSELAAGRVSVLENYSTIIEPIPSAQGSVPSAAQMIAHTLLRAAQSKWGASGVFHK